jgi:hypothetical protein
MSDAQHVTRDWTVTYDPRVYSNVWTLAEPAGATFGQATDASGHVLPAVEKDGQVTVTTNGGTFHLTFFEKTRPLGAFYALDGGPSAAPDSPTSTTVALPTGWTMPGWSGSQGLRAPDGRVWTSTGPFYVEALALPPGTNDPGPDPGFPNGTVSRDATATVRADGASMDVTVEYDTDTFSDAWSLPLPEGAKLVDVTAPLPNTTWSVADGAAQVRTPYPPEHHLGARAFTLHYALDVTTFGGGYERANLSVPGGQNDALTLRVALADGLERVGARLNGLAVAPQPSYATKGAATLSVAFLPPAPAGTQRFTEGPFVVQAPDALVASARDAARQAAQDLPLAATFAVGEIGDAPLHVVYTAAPIFGWEEGVYHGLDATSIRASDLDGSGHANLTAVRTLVHEATHDLVDRQRGGLLLDDSFLSEGLSRLSEAHVELRHPDQVVTCATSGGSQQCSRTSARIDAAELQAFLKSGQPFDVGWNASDVASDQTRGFDYDYSGFVLFHYERVAPNGSLAKALDALHDVLLPSGDQIVGALLAQAPGMTKDDLLAPAKAAAASLDDAAFAAQLGDLVAPPFPSSGGTVVGGVKVPAVGVATVVGVAAALALASRRRA